MGVNTPKYLIIHTTDYPYSKMQDQFKACDGWHKERQFPKSSKGLYIGYHYLFTGGREYICREDSEEGAHCNTQVNGQSMNFQSIGLAVGFDGDIEYMPPVEYTLLQKRVWALQDKYKIPNDRVKYHRDFTPSKTCPGSLIDSKWLVQLLQRPIVVVDKPVEKMCIAEEKEIVVLKERVKWYEDIFNWIAQNFS